MASAAAIPASTANPTATVTAVPSSVAAISATSGYFAAIRRRLRPSPSSACLVAALTHANGAITTIDISCEAPYGYDQRVEVLGSLGMAVSDNERLNRGEVDLAGETHRPVLPYSSIERYETAHRD